MQISSNFNRFYHSVLADFWRKATAARLNIQNSDDFKEGIKSVNPDYPTENDKPISTTKLSNQQLCQHIEFIVMFAGHYGFELQFVADEWERVKQMARRR